jgi:hypothetical protein
MPWDKPNSYLTVKGQRAFNIYASVYNKQLQDKNLSTTTLIAEAANEHHVSYETARADYYAMKKSLSEGRGIPEKFTLSKNEG